MANIRNSVYIRWAKFVNVQNEYSEYSPANTHVTRVNCISQLATSVIFGLKRGNSVRFRGNSGKTWPKQSEFNRFSPKSTTKNRYPPNLDISVRFRPISARYRLVCRKPSNCQHVIFSRQAYMFPVKHTIWRNKESSWESQNAANVLSISRLKKERIKWYMLDALYSNRGHKTYQSILKKSSNDRREKKILTCKPICRVISDPGYSSNVLPIV